MTTTKAWDAVLAHCRVTDLELAQSIADWFKLGVASPESVDPNATTLVPLSIARQYNVFPLFAEDRHLVIATADPCDLLAEQAVGFTSGRVAILTIAAPSVLAELIDESYAPDRAVTNLLDRIDPDNEAKVTLVEEDQPAEGSFLIAEEEEGEGPIVRLTNMVLKDAVSKSASDIHIQPLPTGGVVRLRVDGVLRRGITVPLEVLARIISRIKIMSQLDISDRMRPQDGRARVLIDDRKYDLRVSTVPVRGGEKAVIRILDPQQSRKLDDVGVPAVEVQRLRRVLRNRDGILVVTGPTGSGKTTTMYAALHEISSEDVNIMTVEDPVEYELVGLTQIQVDTKQGVTFQSALKAILRQDPDVIFVGEIRDGATAEMAAQASLTGHLVLATIHANDAVGSVRRFLDLGLDAGTISETLRGALAQRLVRTLCTECAVPTDGDLDDDQQELAVRFGVEPAMKIVGCEECGYSGYRGRRPVVELILPSPELLRMVAEERAHVDLIEQAHADGTRTLLEWALDLVRQGVTTLAEVEHVIGEDSAPSPPPERRTPAPASGSAPRAAPSTTLQSPPPLVPIVPEMPGADLPLDEAQAEPPRVLIVEDDEGTRLLLSTMMEERGWTVTEASDGKEALIEIRRGDPLSLMILDLGLPDIDGMDVLQIVKRSMDTAGIPVIVLTARTTRETERLALEAGASDFVRKPIDAPIFLTRAQAVMRRVTEV